MTQTIEPWSDGTPISVTPSGLCSSGFDVTISVSGNATRGVVLKVSASPDGAIYGDAGTVQDGNATAEAFAQSAETFSVSLPGAKGATVTPHSCADTPLRVSLEFDAY